jgi:hypothetical protein
MTEHEAGSERWYDADDAVDLQAFFDALWHELEPFRKIFVHEAFGPDHRRLWALIERNENVGHATRTWLRIAAGKPGEPTVVVRQTRTNAAERTMSLDTHETRELIGWRLTPD